MIDLSGLDTISVGEKSSEHCAKKGPLPSWCLGAVAVGLLFGVFLSLQKAELLGEQKEALALALKVSALCVGGKMQICAGGETTVFSGGGWFGGFVLFFFF